MITLNPQFIKDANGKNTLVVLTSEEYGKILEELEEAEDIKLYDNAKKGKQEFIEANQAFEEIERNRVNLQN
jgi:hypothetical protein